MIVRNKKPYDIVLTKGNGDFTVNINGKDELTIGDTFQLNDEVLNIVLNKNQNLTLQLMSKEHNGNINLQYLGTKVWLNPSSWLFISNLIQFSFKYNLHVFEKTTYELYNYMPPKKHVDLSSQVISPMPGIVKSVAVQVGQMVNDGAEICIVEAMKMQNKLNATRTGKVNYFKPGLFTRFINVF